MKEKTVGDLVRLELSKQIKIQHNAVYMVKLCQTTLSWVEASLSFSVFFGFYGLL